VHPSKFVVFLFAALGFISVDIQAQNPIILDQFTADPAARVFDGKVYLYPSHDILAVEGKGRPGWFCMEDYHVFSSENLCDWTDHGVIVSQDKVPWVNANFYALWAPDCIRRNGKYYFYFPAPPADTTLGRGFFIGVAVSDKPDGPFIPQPGPMLKARGIDPNPFIDKDGQAYLYWAARNFYVAKLKENMLELASEPQVVQGLPEKGLKEGPFVFERNGLYYLTFPHVENKIERLEYAISRNPMGPFQVAGVLMDESPDSCWTNQPSIIEYQQQWYLFYHSNDLSPRFDKNRSVRIDSLFFNDDGTIKKVVPSLRGVGITDASQKIQIDRYSRTSPSGVTVAFQDTLCKSNGWKVTLYAKHSWVQYNAVDFGERRYTTVSVRAAAEFGAKLLLRQQNAEGLIIAKVTVPKAMEWKTVTTSISGLQPGIQNLVMVHNDENPVAVDWIKFE